MPLRAMYGDANVFAYECAAAQWAELKTSYKTKKLTMPCCGNGAIPKTSQLGTFFFSHTRQGECTTAPESAEHVYVKTLIAKAAVGAGWWVATEWPGETPDGEKWIADVFCKKGKASVALEVQMSYQSPSEMRVRQQRYKNSGVRCSWFLSSTIFKSNYSRPGKETPFFCLSPIEIGKEPSINEFAIGITDFVKGMLNGRLTWKEDPSEYHIQYINDACYKCHSPVKQVYGYNIDVYGDSVKTVPNASTVLEKMLGFISNDDLKKLGLNTIGRFDKMNGKVVNYPYCNVCIHCGAPQNNFYLLQNLEKIQRNPDNEQLGSTTFLKDEGHGAWCFNCICYDLT